ncbi:MAG: hypothetical protein FJW39_11045 [Acidobacteria bacterium]|nr:hypothetical protein [Acidobacteriota bacterium]
MALGILKQVKRAIEQLNPSEVRQDAERPLDIRIIAPDAVGHARIEEFLVPDTMSAERRKESLRSLFRASGAHAARDFDVDIYSEGMDRPRGAFVFRPDRPHRMVSDVLDAKPGLWLALARNFQAFHKPVADKIVYQVSKENAMFSIATALPDIAPGISIPWAIPEAVSDSAVLTVNQVRMAFLLAAASNRPVGYREQKPEVASIIAGAVGWRAIARELVSKIPLGGGIIPKAAIAFAATYVEGKSLERLYRAGYGFTASERKDAYEDAFTQGKDVAKRLLDSVREKKPEE